MKSWIILGAIVAVTVSGDEWGLLNFEGGPDDLDWALYHDESLWEELSSYLNVTTDLKEEVVYELRHEFNVATITIKEFEVKLTEIINYMLKRKMLSRNHEAKVRKLLGDALLWFAGEMNSSHRDESGNATIYHKVPYFCDDYSEYAELLNMVLVESERLIDQADGLRTLCNYAQNGLRLVNSLLGNPYTRFDGYSLRRMWNERAELFYDFRNETPYIRHSYSLDRPRPYTLDDPAIFISRRHISYTTRNPPASTTDTLSIMQLFPEGRKNQNIYEFYAQPDRVPTTESDIYYEIRENRFLRTLFFFLELTELDIVRLNDIDNVRPSTSRRIPESLWDLLQDDTAYPAYLESRYNEENNYSGGQLARADEDQINEFELLGAFYNRVKSGRVFTTTTSKTTTTTVSSSSTSGYKKSEKGKGFYDSDLIKQGPGGKWLPKPRDSKGDEKDPNTSDKSNKETHDKYHSHYLQPDETLFPEKQETLLNILKVALCSFQGGTLVSSEFRRR